MDFVDIGPIVTTNDESVGAQTTCPFSLHKLTTETPLLTRMARPRLTHTFLQTDNGLDLTPIPSLSCLCLRILSLLAAGSHSFATTLELQEEGSLKV